MTAGLALLFFAPPPVDVAVLVRDSLQRWGTPGVVVVLVRTGQPDFVQGFGTAAAGKPDPLTPEMPFPLASCTKAFTTTLLAALADDGLLAWDDKLRDFAAGFALNDPHAGPMLTLRDCCSHRTGLAGHDLLWYRAEWPLSESLARASKLPLDLPFRGAFRYCSLPVSAAGRAAAARAGKPWEQLVKDRITGPLGMTSAAFTTKDAVYTAAKKPAGHRRTATGVEPMPPYAMPEPNPAGSMLVAPRDMAAWLKFHLNGGKGLLTPAAHAELFSANVPLKWDAELRRTNPDTVQMNYALGWLVYDFRGHRVAAHGGKIDGFRTHVALFPDDGFGIALFNNLHDTTMNQALANKIADGVLGMPAKDWDGLFLKAEAETDAEKAEALKSRAAARRNLPPLLPPGGYAGAYKHAAYGTATVTAAGTTLMLNWGTFAVPLEAWDAEQYRVTDGFFADQLVEFRVRGGKADGLRFAGQVFER